MTRRQGWEIGRRSSRRNAAISGIRKISYTVFVETKVVQLRGRGTLTLPAKIRERYSLEEGDPITLVDLDGVVVLAPKVGIVPKLAAEIERLADASGVDLEDLLAGMKEERRRSVRDRLARS